MMLIISFLTIGYFVGVITALVIFPPKVKEIEMQEKDAASVINIMERLENPQLIPATDKNLRLGISN